MANIGVEQPNVFQKVEEIIKEHIASLTEKETLRLKGLKSEIGGLEQGIENKKIERDVLEADIKNLEIKKTQESSKLDEIVDKVINGESKNSELEEHRKVIQPIVDKLDEELKEKKADKEKLTLDIKDLENKKTQLRESLEKEQGEYDALLVNKGSAESEIIAQRDTLSKLKADIDEAKELKARQIESMQAEIDVKQEKLGNLKKTEAEVEQKFKSRESEVLKKESEAQAKMDKAELKSKEIDEKKKEHDEKIKADNDLITRDREGTKVLRDVVTERKRKLEFYGEDLEKLAILLLAEDKATNKSEIESILKTVKNGKA